MNARRRAPQFDANRSSIVYLFLRKKDGRATSGDRGGEPTDQVARPLLGDRRWVSGEEIVSASIAKAKLVPRKNRDKRYMVSLDFFLFLRRGVPGSLELGHFSARYPLLQVATAPPDAISECWSIGPVQLADCRKLTAAAALTNNRCARGQDRICWNALESSRSKIEVGSFDDRVRACCRTNLSSKKNDMRTMVGWEAMVRVLLPKGSGRSAAW
jgi:hypothetical protein